jgi:NAD(P)-dependent dehydrogenase (short-subunit alcohol dehydrogenase family)
MQSLRGHVALITGGGSGLGEALCRTLAEAGVTVIVGDIRAQAAEHVAAAIRSTEGQATALPLDVSDERQAAAAIAQIRNEHERLDILINSAGTDVTLPVEELSGADWERVLAVNLNGPFLLSKYAMNAMRLQGGGAIVNIVSTAAKRAWANASAYHASKWGLLGLTYALHVEGRLHNIKVTAIIPGGMRTPFLLDRFPDLDPRTLQDPRTVADAVLFALSQPPETVIPEMMVVPMRETSWP